MAFCQIKHLYAYLYRNKVEDKKQQSRLFLETDSFINIYASKELLVPF